MIKGSNLNTNTLVLLSIFILGFNYLLFLGLDIIESSYLIVFFRVIVILIIFLACFVKQSDVKYLAFFVLLILSISIFNNNKQTINLMFIALLINLFKYTSIETLLKYLFSVSLYLVLIHFILVILDFLPSDAVIMYQVGERVRFTLGFANPNALAVFYASLFYTSYYYYTMVVKKFTIFSYFIFLVSFVVMYLSGSRTLFYTSCIFVLIAFIPTHIYSRRIVRFLLALLPLIFSILTMFIALQHSSEWNEALSLRPILFFNFLSKVDAISVLSGLEYTAEDLVDNSYILLFASCGLPLYMVLLFLVSCKIYRTRAEYFPFVFFALASSVFESFLFRPEFTITMLFFACVFSKSKLKTNN